MEILFDENREAEKLIYSHDGVIFGGYVRDHFAKLKPNDIDCAIPESKSDSFYDKLKEFGYKLFEQNVYIKPNSISITVIENDDEDLKQKEITNIQFSCQDYDVNILAYNGNEFFLYTGGDINYLDIIIDHIKNKQMVRLGDKVNDKRKIKMESKGFREIKFVWPVYIYDDEDSD